MIRLDSILAKLFTNPKCGDMKRNSLNRTISGFSKISRDVYKRQVYGLRDNVKLIREDANGKQQIVTLDLNNAETILSPYYWLQQNDIVYITPNKAKARNSDVGNSTSLWFSATSILVSVVSLLVNILK